MITGRQSVLPAGGRATVKSDRRRGVLRWLPAFVATAAILVLTFGSASLVSAVDPTPLTVSFTAQSRDYDSTTDAVILSCDIEWGEDVPDPDVDCEGTGVADFASEDVGSPTVTADPEDFELTGANAEAYDITAVESTTATISAIDLTVTATGNDKVYDGSDDATVDLTTDAIDGDDVAADYADANFADKNVNVGPPKSVSVTGISTSGDDATNYNLVNTTAATTANITARDLTVDADGDNRGYNGTTTATVTWSDDRVGTDSLFIAYTANFDNRNAGSGKAVSVSGISISGTGRRELQLDEYDGLHLRRRCEGHPHRDRRCQCQGR